MSTSDLTTDPPVDRDPVEALAEVFLERYRRGERPSLSEFTAVAPEHADEIRELFPALVLLEQAQPTQAPGSRLAAAGKLERIGDYRLIREVGRGGMGVVFEAEQETLGRRVALKVLPTAAGSSSSALLRFRREARSAARLHHTNIVPVFDVGERDGVHFYAMQFIHGQGLDEIITELRRLREPGSPPPRFAPTVVALTLPLDDPTGAPSGEPIREPIREPCREPSGESSGSNPSAVFFDPLSTSTQGDSQFYQSVAKIGLQVAEALAYAHGQRVLHRDIKPANILLDARGTAWVTDFGLAKEAGDDLTRTGDIVGTLRYMAPERFNGKSDATSDVYGLGITLYELATLRPAFHESDRAQLVRAIMQREPPAPRSVDPSLPRDLETIILKAIAKEPADRYASAEALAGDLRRFLGDLPLLARRVAPWERVARWCRRNPGWAATLAAAISLLVVVAVGGALFSMHLKGALTDLEIAREQEQEQLWRSHVERARALRTSNRVGQRFAALAAIREAAKIKVTRELRDEAVAALVLPDVEVVQEWDGFPAGTVMFTHDADLKTYARINDQGELTLCRVTPQGEEVLARTTTARPAYSLRLWISPDGRFVALSLAGSASVGEARLKVWRRDGETLTLRRDLSGPLSHRSVAFRPDSRVLAIGRSPETVLLVDLESDEPPREVPLGGDPRCMAYHPTENRLAASCGTSIRVLDVDAERVVAELKVESVRSWNHGVAWHPDGRVLAASAEDLKIHLWDVERATEMMPPLEGHSSSGIYMAFNRRGDRLLSSSWDGRNRLWDAVSGELLLTMPGQFGLALGPDDATLGIGRAGEKLQIGRLADGRELRRIRRPHAERGEMMFHPVLHPQEPVVVTSTMTGIVFFDHETGRELGLGPFENYGLAYVQRFDPAGGWLTAGRQPGAAVWPAVRDPQHPKTLRVGPPRRLASAADAGIDVTPDGRYRAIPRGSYALVLDRDTRDANGAEKRIVVSPHVDVRSVAIHPQGTYVATFSWHPDGRYSSVRIWNAQDAAVDPANGNLLRGKHVIDLPVSGSAIGSFSPDGRWLMTFGSASVSQLWDTATWQPVRTLPGSLVCWTSRGDRLAVNDGEGQIAILDPATGAEVLRLTSPDPQAQSPAGFSADGTRLVSRQNDQRHLLVWDLPRIGRQVRELGLEWDWPDPPPSAPRPPLPRIEKVEVDLGAWAAPPKASPWQPAEKWLQDGLRLLRPAPANPAARSP